MIRKLNQLVGLILATKLMTWVVPDSKRFIKGIITAAITILFAIYFHSEYLRWAEISGNINLVSTSYILKNLIILISLIVLYFYLKKTPKLKEKKKSTQKKIMKIILINSETKIS